MLLRQLIRSPHNMNLIRRIATSTVLKNQTVTTNIDYNQLVLVDVNDKNGYATVTLNRPPVNSFNLELMMGLSRALDQVERNNSRGMILTSVNIFRNLFFMPYSSYLTFLTACYLYFVDNSKHFLDWF